MAFDRETSLTSGNDTYSAPNDTLEDKIKGLGGSDTLNGGGGEDEIFGDGEWFDVFVNDGNDTLHGNDGNDTLHGGNGADRLFGDAGIDTLLGDGGDDRLDGGSGADTMKGGGGNDVYVVDNVSDVVDDDLLFGGTDRVESSISFNLSNAHNVENLTLTGTASINGTGNNSDNVITGNSGFNTLSGSGGKDTLNGGAGGDRLDGGAGSDTIRGEGGNDTIVINSSSETDTLIDGGADIDKVESSISFSLNSTVNVENLTLVGTAAINGTGNSAANVITGNVAANTLNGGSGNDTLRGDFGNDVLNGGNDSDTLSGGQGNDVLNGEQGTDTLDGGLDRDRYNGGSESDVLMFDASDFSAGAFAGQYDGGTGIDTVRLPSLVGSLTLDLRTIDNAFIQNVEVIDLRVGSTSAQMSLEFNDVFSINSSHSLRIDGDASDRMTVTDFGWDDTGRQQSIGSQVYDVYTNGQATLLVDADIQVNGSFV